MTWQAIDGDTNAKRFYEEYVGATCQKEWLTYKLKGDKFYNGNSDVQFVYISGFNERSFYF